jgi:hypothetical protein
MQCYACAPNKHIGPTLELTERGGLSDEVGEWFPLFFCRVPQQYLPFLFSA